jgi:hypothetical protein
MPRFPDNNFTFGPMQYRVIVPSTDTPVRPDSITLGITKGKQAPCFFWTPVNGIMIVLPTDEQAIRALDTTTHPLIMPAVRDPIRAALSIQFLKYERGLWLALVMWALDVPDELHPLFMAYHAHSKLTEPRYEPSVWGATSSRARRA